MEISDPNPKMGRIHGEQRSIAWTGAHMGYAYLIAIQWESFPRVCTILLLHVEFNAYYDDRMKEYHGFSWPALIENSRHV